MEHNIKIEKNSMVVLYYVSIATNLGVSGRGVAHTVHVGAVQGAVAHVMYRVREVPAAEHHRRLADDDQHADGSHVLRSVRRSCATTLIQSFDTSKRLYRDPGR